MSLSIQNNLKKSNYSAKPLSFGATRSIGEFVMPNVIKSYLSQNSYSNLSMIVDNTKNLLDMLKRGLLEFCFIEGHFNKADYETYLMSYEDFVFVSSPKNPICNKSNLKVEDLFSENLIIREQGSGSRDIFEMWLFERNYTTKNFSKLLQIGNINIIKELVKDNYGISIIYKVAVLEEIKNKELVVLDVDSMNLSHEFNFIFLKESIYADEYIEFYNKIKNF